MFCRWNITIYTGKIFPIVFWMKYLRFRRLTFAVTSRSCLILEIFGSTDLHCSLLKESCSDVVILPGVTQVEVDEFMLTIYGQNFVTEDKYSSGIRGETNIKCELSTRSVSAWQAYIKVLSPWTLWQEKNSFLKSNFLWTLGIVFINVWMDNVSCHKFRC